jgi:hypothetical protein
MAKSERTRRKGIDLEEADAAVFYKAFCSMDSTSRRRLALRILKDEALLEDLYDHFLIQEADKAKGRSIPWVQYLEKRQRRTS